MRMYISDEFSYPHDACRPALSLDLSTAETEIAAKFFKDRYPKLAAKLIAKLQEGSEDVEVDAVKYAKRFLAQVEGSTGIVGEQTAHEILMLSQARNLDAQTAEIQGRTA